MFPTPPSQVVLVVVSMAVTMSQYPRVEVSSICPDQVILVVVGGGRDELSNLCVLDLVSSTEGLFLVSAFTRDDLGGILAMDVLVVILTGKILGPIPMSH